MRKQLIQRFKGKASKGTVISVCRCLFHTDFILPFFFFQFCIKKWENICNRTSKQQKRMTSFFFFFLYWIHLVIFNIKNRALWNEMQTYSIRNVRSWVCLYGKTYFRFISVGLHKSWGRVVMTPSAAGMHLFRSSVTVHCGKVG